MRFGDHWRCARCFAHRLTLPDGTSVEQHKNFCPRLGEPGTIEQVVEEEEE